MKFTAGALSLFLLSSYAYAAKDCAELKSEIAAKIDAKGVKGYSLDIVDNGDVKDQKVVGTCAAGKKSIVYSREGAAAPDKKTPEKSAPAAPAKK